MRLSVMVFGLVCVCALVIGTAAPFVQDEEDVRGAFLTSRPKDKPASSGKTTRPSRRKPKSTGGSTSSGSTSSSSNKPNKPVDKTPNKPESSVSTAPSSPVTPVNATAHWAGCDVVYARL